MLNNNMLAVKADYWEQENGRIDNSEEIAELQERIEELEDTITPDSTDEHDKAADEQIRDLERKIEELREQEEEYPEVFQWYIISDNGASILKDYTNEIVYYNSELDMYLWGITHYGTSWDYVLTDIKIELDDYRA